MYTCTATRKYSFEKKALMMRHFISLSSDFYVKYKDDFLFFTHGQLILTISTHISHAHVWKVVDSFRKIGISRLSKEITSFHHCSLFEFCFYSNALIRRIWCKCILWKWFDMPGISRPNRPLASLLSEVGVTFGGIEPLKSPVRPFNFF